MIEYIKSFFFAGVFLVGALCGFTSGFYTKDHWFSSMKLLKVQYVNNAHKVIQGVAIKYNKDIYYPSSLVNHWLTDHNKNKSALRGDL